MSEVQSTLRDRITRQKQKILELDRSGKLSDRRLRYLRKLASEAMESFLKVTKETQDKVEAQVMDLEIEVAHSARSLDRSRIWGSVFGAAFVLLALVIVVLAGEALFREFWGEAKHQRELLLIFALSSFFPVSAFAYQLFRRKTLVRRLGRDFWLLGIDVKGWRDDLEKRSDPWSREAYSQVVDTLYERAHSSWNYAIQTSLAVLLTIFGLVLFFWPPPTGTGELFDQNTLQAMRYGFVGAYIFSAQLVYRRYTTSDLQPTVYAYCALTLIGGLAFNFVAFTAIRAIAENPETAQGLEGGVLAIVAFSLGYFPYLAIRWFNRVAHTALGMPQRRADALHLGLIDGISQFHETRLRDEGIDNIQNLASVALDELLLNTRFSAQEVVEWVDQAILYLYLEPGEIESFRRAGVRSFTDLQDQWGQYRAEKVERKLQDTGLEISMGNLRMEMVSNTDEALEEQLAFFKQEYEDLKARLEQTRKERALQFQTLPERLDGLYRATQQGPNVAHVQVYWQRAIDVQKDVEEAMQDERRREKERLIAHRAQSLDTWKKLPEDARRELTSSLEEDVWWSDYGTLIEYGREAADYGDYEGALSYFQQAADLNPDDGEAFDLQAAANLRLAAIETMKERKLDLMTQAEMNLGTAWTDTPVKKGLDLVFQAVREGRSQDASGLLEALARYLEYRYTDDYERLNRQIEELEKKPSAQAPGEGQDVAPEQPESEGQEE
jgi:tetratricopeptide (TPR) repeat protein